MPALPAIRSLTALLVLVATTVLGEGCNRVEIVNLDPGRARPVKSVVLVPFKGLDPNRYMVKGDPADEDVREWNEKAQADYGAHGKRFLEVTAKALPGVTSLADEAPKQGYYVIGHWDKINPGSSGLRIGGAFTPMAGAAMQEEGKVEVRFTCWLKEAGKEKELPIATLSGAFEDAGSWSGGYDKVWDLSETLAEHLAERLKQICPGMAGGG